MDGLRREEVALLAGISPDYYVRPEQGRANQVPDSVLDAVADALRLDATERDHLRNLVPVGPYRRQRNRPVSPVRPSTRRMVERLDAGPAYLVDQSLNLLAWNHLTTILFGDLASRADGERKLARFVFLDPVARDVFVD